MTDLRQAAQQALEALEDWWGSFPDFRSLHDKVAIAALRTALEQQQAEPAALKSTYHPCTSILIEGLKKLKAWDVLAEWDREREIVDERLNTTTKQQQAEPVCWCRKCNENRLVNNIPFSRTRMILCPTCGNKRCPKASDHRLGCTDSNAAGQPGSAYPAPPQQQAEALQAMNDQLTTGTSIMLDGKRVDPASMYKPAEPVCPDCKAAVLYECVACSSNNYPPKQQAEPIGWLDRTDMLAGFRHRDFKAAYDKRGSATPRDFTIPVYTTPPQRLALTDEQVHKAMVALNTQSCGELQPTFEEMKVAIEAAHGIKEGA